METHNTANTDQMFWSWKSVLYLQTHNTEHITNDSCVSAPATFNRICHGQKYTSFLRSRIL